VDTDLWYALPLVVAISLVYSATRHELLGDILRGAVRTGAWFGGFVVVTLSIVYLLDAWAF